MRYLLAAALALLGGAGCSAWQANKGSQAVEFDPLWFSSGNSLFSPANGPGYLNGDPQDGRTRH